MTRLPTIKQLQCFLAVAQELSFRKAAERLKMTQPPLTRQIKNLEDLLGQQLFTRNTHEVYLTDAGQVLALQAENVLNELRILTLNFVQRETHLRVGLTRVLNFGNIPVIKRQIQKMGLGKDIDTYNMTSSQLVQCLLKNMMDIVLTGEQSQEDGVQFHWLYNEPLLLAMPTAHSASAQDKVSLPDVADLPLFWFVRSANPAFYDKCEKYFSRLPVTLKRIKEPVDSLITLSLVAEGKGVALIPESMCTLYRQGLCYQNLSDDAARHLNIGVYVAIRKHEDRPVVLQALAAFLSEAQVSKD